MGSLQIDVLGASFAIKANEDEAYLKKMLGYYKKITDQLEKGGMMKNPLHISILAGIMLCDELYKEKSKNAKYSETLTDPDDQAEKLTIELIKKLDAAIQ